MTKAERSTLEIALYRQLNSSGIVLAMLAGLFHNLFLSAGDALVGPIPSTHPMTAIGFCTVAAAIYFRPAWRHALRFRTVVSSSIIAICALRIAEALWPEIPPVLSSGGLVTARLEAVDLHGQFSVESAVFLACCFAFELFAEGTTFGRLFLVSICLMVLSVGFSEMINSVFLWGDDLSIFTQLAMGLVVIDMLKRMRNQQPFRSLFRPGRTSFFLQFTALALYLLPTALGAVLLHEMKISQGNGAPFEMVFAGTSCTLLGIVALLAQFLDHAEDTEAVAATDDPPATGPKDDGSPARCDNSRN